ncbi:hypothetical protein A5707_15390 [Mycobacterium kyorinense]|uniref:Uncharacterized protein n=1 Tax=Mycobacterium kyorinense TaxID=487514 RepID=A0A1A2ZII0_9MYCO|nr:hypothetical protein [Mycobacterium kyorinense]OBI50065.1 hypothetical protein A5707_15390 [Mycobacterium kyorinense]
MAERLDVAARLAEGAPAVEHTQTYVNACRAVGYQHPDLTARDSQIRDWYEAEAGMQLRTLDNDCAALWAALNAADEALALQRAQVGELDAAWRGPGADSATQFLHRHCETAAAVVAAVRTASQECGALRDNVWQLIDGKVATAIAVDDRTQQTAWLAAAHTVATGAGDRSAAENVIREQVIPYVDNDIRVEWLTAMRSATESVAAAYDAVLDALAAGPEVRFELPSDLGPRPQLEEVPGPIGGVGPIPEAPPPVATTPAAVSTPLPPPAPASPLPTDILDALPADEPLPEAALGDGAGMPTGAGTLGGLGGLGGSIGGVVGQIIDGIAGLVGSLTDGLGDPSVPDDAPFDDELDGDDPVDEAADERPDREHEPPPADTVEDGAAADTSSENPETTEQVGGQPVAQHDSAPPPTIAPAPVAPTPPAPPPEGPAPADPTPCQIAADELPQAGQ